MTKKEMVKKIMNKKAQFACVTYSKTCKTKKGAPIVTKVTRARNIRIGADYNSIKAVQELKGTTNTEDTANENAGLVGAMKFVAYPYLIENEKNGKEYVRINTNKNSKFDTRYFIAGNEVSKEEVLDYLYASEKNHRGDVPIVMNIGLDSILEIH